MPSALPGPASLARQTAWPVRGGPPTCKRSLLLLSTETFSFSRSPSPFPLSISSPGSIRWSLKRISLYHSFLSLNHFLLILAALTVSLLSFIPSLPLKHLSNPHLLQCSSSSFPTTWLCTPLTATYCCLSYQFLLFFPPLRPSFSLPLLSPTLPPNALLWSHRSPYWWQHLAMVHERVSRFLSPHCTVIVAVMP